MRCGIQFQIKKEGKNGETSFHFISLSALFSTAVCGPKGRREKGSKE